MRGKGAKSMLQRLISLALVCVMVVGYIPVTTSADTTGPITTVSDPATLSRPEEIYGNNTANAGKITVGKSVSDADLDSIHEDLKRENPDNFLVTVSQTAQVAGLSSQTSVPVDVVFVLDTSNSMQGSKVTTMITAANSAIKSLMEANPNNRVGVVAFSGPNGAGNSGGASASILTQLGSYEAYDDHIQWTNKDGKADNKGSYIAGRGNNRGIRLGTSQGTNIHAGVALGGKMLATATATTVNVNGSDVSRIPFLVVMSDGAPTYGAAGEWYDPDLNEELGNVSEQDGLGFLAALTAAYYKGRITQHYFGNTANADKRCFVYSIGLELEKNGLAEMTMDPANATSANSYLDNFEEYWEDYQIGETTTNDNYSYTVNVASKGTRTYRITKASIDATSRYVNGTGMGYTGGYKYNDGYYAASQADELEDVFGRIVSTIAEKAISFPTSVITTPEFSGYVTFTDPIGEFMEVKNIKGVYADDNLYAGRRAAQYLNGTYSEGRAEFLETLDTVLKARLTMTDSQNVDELVDSLISGRMNSTTITDNSITWWGSKIASSEESHVQCLGYADVTNDNMTEFIKTAEIPADLDAVPDVLCRSYLFYGTASGSLTEDESNHDYMYFMVRIQQDLKPPYQQTVVISAPASLLSVDAVMITENKDGSAVAKIVNDDQPARVIYEVGLRSDINITNVKSVVEAEMPSYATEGGNVDENGNYQFYTNDWERNSTEVAHHVAKAKATFEAALDNPFYAYQTNEPILVKNGDTYIRYTGDTAPVSNNNVAYYYAREYYDWDDNINKPNPDGTYNAVKRTAYIPISIAANEPDIAQDSNGWYVKQGTYTAHSLVVNGEDIDKKPNNTGTASIVSHPHKTDSGSDGHYTVLLGNNGRLTMSYVKTKDVYKTDAANAKISVDGKTVGIGDKLTYEINVVNTESVTATAQVTDQIPAGTVYVANSASNGGIFNNDTKTLTWNLTGLKPGSTTTLSFQVQVTEDVVAHAVTSVNNQAAVSLNNKFAYNTNITTNPPEGKISSAAGNSGTLPENAVLKVGDQLTYTIRYSNDSDQTATVVVTDQIPAGTTYKQGSASSGGELKTDANGKQYLEWTIQNVPAGLGGTVSFAVYVDASAKVNSGASVQPETGNIVFENQATIQIGTNDPRYTNKTTDKGDVGNLSLTKSVAVPEGVNVSGEEFTMILSESAGKLNGTYVVSGSSAANSSTITFENGVGRVSLKANDVITVKGLPLGATIAVIEDSTGMEEWVDTYQNNPTDEDGVSIVVTKTTGSATAVDVSVKNTFVTVPVEFQLHAQKQFSENFPAGDYTFAFQAQECDENGTPKTDGRLVYATATKGEGTAPVSFSFTPRKFDAPITRYYLVSEQSSTDPHINTDHTQYLLKLTIGYPTGSNALEAQTWYKQVGVHSEWQTFDWKDPAKSPFVFKNTYIADTSTAISGTKELTGRYITDGEFSFELLESLSPEKVISNTSVTATGTSNSGTFSFPRHYSVNDLIVNGVIVDENPNNDIEGERTFTYYVRETNKGETGIKYDTKVYQVDVKLTLDDGVLAAARTAIRLKNGDVFEAANTVAFTNEFELEDVSVRLHTSKTVTGDHTLTAGEFTFSVYEANASYKITNNKPVASGANGDSTKNEDGSYVAGVDLGLLEYVPDDLKDASGNYMTSKTFYYVVKENIPATDAPTFDPGMFYDSAEKHFSVTVSRSGNQMTAVVNGEGVTSSGEIYQVPGFTNHRVSKETSVTPVAQKTTTGNHLPDNLRFSFAVRPATVVTNDGQLTVTGYSGAAATGISQTAAKDGTAVDVDFTKLVYNDSHLGSNESAVFYYVIEESNSGVKNGVTYDTTKYLMQVTLTRDTTSKRLSTAVTYYPLAKAEDKTLSATSTSAVTKPSFTNVYDSEASVNVTATKTLTGRNLADGEFDFRLQRVVKQGDGSFAPVEGSLINGTNTGNTVTFGTINFVRTQLEQFEYVSAKEEVKDEAGNVTAEAEPEHWLAYYQMSEIKPDDVPLAGVDYDTNTHIVTVKLYYTQKDENTSELRAELVNIPNGGYSFTNSYEPQNEAQVTITAKKTLTGRELRDGEFAFNLYRVGSDGEHFAAGATNDKDGNITFTRVYNTSVLQFPENQNTYEVVYHLTETPPATGGVSWVSGDYYVKVVITHNTDTASYSAVVEGYYTGYENGVCTGRVDDPEENVVFVNKYVPAGTSFEIGATKQLLDKDSKKLAITENQFSFTVKEVDEDGNVLNATANAGTGNSAACDPGKTSNVVFTPISVSTAGDHYYEITEVTGTNPLITYTDAKYYVKATVTDPGNGKLNITSKTYHTGIPCTDENKVEPSTVLFENHQGNGEVNVVLDVDKTVHVLNAEGVYVRTHNLTGGEYDFAVYDAANHQVASGTNTATNAHGIADIVFDNFSITLDQFGENETDKVFTYTVKEIGGDQTATDVGVTLDSSIITVKVTVHKDDHKNLTVTKVECSKNQKEDNLFVNTFKFDEVTLSLSGTKGLTGKELTAGEFQFELSGGNLEEAVTATNDANGKINFGTLPAFLEPGTFIYTVKEIPKEYYTVDGVTYGKYSTDTRETTVVVTVTADTTGKLHPVAMYYRNYGEENQVTVGGIAFSNLYVPTPVTLDLNAAIGLTKTITDETGNQMNLPLNGFEFELVGITGDNNAKITGITDAQGVVDFPAISFSDDTTYSFYIRESDRASQDVSKQGYVMDPDSWMVEVTVSYNGGLTDVTYTNVEDEEATAKPGELYIQKSNVKIVPNESGETDGVFTNVYKPISCQVEITVEKILEGRDLRTGEFTFYLKEGARIVAETTNAADGTVTFTVPYTGADMNGAVNGTTKTFNYTIEEVAGNAGGVTYDNDGIDVTVTVTDTNGSLNAVVTYDDDVTFVNEYSAEKTEAEIGAFKTLEGRNLVDGMFSFVLTGNGETHEAHNRADGSVVFDPITYTQAGVYEYTLKENIPAEKVRGMEYDDHVYTVEVTVTDDYAGQLHASVAYYDQDDEVVTTPEFINEFDGDAAFAEIQATKLLETDSNRVLKGEEFSFQLIDASGNVVETVKNDVNGHVMFTAIPYEEAGVHEYTIKEVAGTEVGMIYDETEFKVTVTVVQDEETGHYVATVAYDEAPVFKNHFEVQSVSVTLEASKELTGRKLTADEFTFELVDDATGEVLTASNAEDGSITFGSIVYDKAGIYEYTIREVKGNAEGITYDETEYKATVTIIDTDGVLSAEVAYETDGKVPVFVNKFIAKSVEVTITANKQLHGRYLKKGEFDFVLTDADGNQRKATNDKNGLITFEPIEFNKPGVYEFTVSEIAGRENGMKYDKNTYRVTVTVTDTDGVLSAEVDYTDGDILFENTFTGRPAHAKIEAKKTLKTDSLRVLKAGEFTFQLIDAQTGEVLQTKTNNVFGNVHFDAIEYNAEGQYKYLIKEVIGTESGMTYDETVYEVVVWVTQDPVTGDYVAVVVYKTADGKRPAFINYFKPGAVLVRPEAEKQLTGRPLQAGEFTFTVYDSEGKKVGTASNNADGKILFDAISFDKAGVYTFTMVEEESRNQLGSGTMTFDKTVHTFTVTVTDTDGVLTAEIAYEDGGIVFRNTYTGASTTASISAKKRLDTESTRLLKAGEFSFQLIDENGNVLQTKTNNIFGNVAFDAISYTEEGEYEYIIREVPGNETGMTYDKTQHKVVVKVVKGATTGDLGAQVIYETSDGQRPTFINVFKPLSVSVNLTADKKLTGRALKNGEFSFTVYDADGNKQATGTNNAKGKIVFSDLTFSQTGVYKFTVKENKGMSWYMTYDRKSYEATVTITEEEGVLKAKVAYPDGDITFHNIYNPSGDIIPQTGDETPLALLIGIAATSGICLAALFVFWIRKRKRKD